MGNGIFGMEAAAQHNFKKPALRLTEQEAAMIAACLPNPKKYTIRRMSKPVATRYPWIVRQLSNLSGDEDLDKIVGNSYAEKATRK